MGSPVFDGARAFDGMVPDLDKHCERLVDSTRRMLMTPPVTAEELLRISIDGIKKFKAGEDLYIRPLVWAEQSDGLLRCVADSARFCVTVVQMPMPPETGLSACMASERRPAPDTAPTDAKAACLYPNFARSMQKARLRQCCGLRFARRCRRICVRQFVRRDRRRLCNALSQRHLS